MRKRKNFKNKESRKKVYINKILMKKLAFNIYHKKLTQISKLPKSD